MKVLERKELGQGLTVSAMGLGCMGMTHGFGKPSDIEEMIQVIREAYENGITMFDTAECYQGIDEEGNTLYNEDLVGEALCIYPRESYQIATKCGIKVIDGKQVLNAKPEVIKKSLEDSLKRLKTDYIDIYYLHRIDPETPIEVVANTMKELKEEGKIRHWGLSEAGVDTIKKAHAICPLSVVESEYSMLFREPEKNGLLEVLEKLQIGFIPFAPLGKGFLTATIAKEKTFEKTDTRSRQPRFRKENMEQNQILVNLVKSIAEKKNATPAQIALAWVIAQKDWIVPIPGSRNIERIKENIGALNIKFTKQELQNIRTAVEGMELKADRWDPDSPNARRIGK